MTRRAAIPGEPALRRTLATFGFAIALPLNAMAAPRLLPTTLPDIATVAAPPAGFDPLRASDADLDAYGFPPRPSKMQGTAYAHWVRMVAGAKIRITPQLRRLHREMALPVWVPAPFAPRAPAVTQSSNIPVNDYSRNWSGMVVANGAASLGGSSITQAAGDFNVSIAELPFGTCNTGVHYSTWVGLDGVNSGDILQAGVEGDAYCTSAGSSAYYYPWMEWFPAGLVQITNLLISPGDIVIVFIAAKSATTGFVLVENATSNQYVVMSPTAPAGTSFKGTSAEWILERPTFGTTISNLANYVRAFISDTGAAVGNTWFNYAYPPAGNSALSVQMLDNGGNLISQSTWLWPNCLDLADAGSAK